MRKKSTLKRMLAGISAITTTLSAVPLSAVTVSATEEDYTSASNVQYLYEMLNYLQEGIHFLQTQIKSLLIIYLHFGHKPLISIKTNIEGDKNGNNNRY